MNERDAFAATIRMLLKGEKASKIAAKAGIQKSTLSEYMNGKKLPRRRNFEAVARALGCTPEKIEELMWHLRTGGRSAAPTLDFENHLESSALKMRNLLFEDRRDPLGLTDDLKLKNILDEISASSYHFNVARGHYVAAMTKLVEYLAEGSGGRKLREPDFAPDVPPDAPPDA